MSAKDAQQVSLQSLYHPNDTLEVFTAKLKSVTNGSTTDVSIGSVDNGISKKDMRKESRDSIAKKYFILFHWFKYIRSPMQNLNCSIAMM